MPRQQTAAKRTLRPTPPAPDTRPAPTADLPAARERRLFRRRLLEWYDEFGRDLPWRRASDPYQILVSEIMLQQTQVDRVLPKYEEWLRKYPTLAALAEAHVDEVVAAWYPLGYNIRPRRLHSIAREAVASYGGRLPSDEPTLLSFHGIGQYTAGAIRSFAFGERAAILDTNVARVLYRVFAHEGGDGRRSAGGAGTPGKPRPGDTKVKKRLWAISRALLPRKRVFDFNQALMDFGALVCVARKPKCLLCPMASICRSRGPVE